ncbi:MAG: DNA gyrase subunit A [Pseudomonadota bacterium]
MVKFAKEILPVNIEDEMKQSYLDYAMSVIVGRALPDVRDGLKPVHRRSLYAMHGLGNAWNKPYKKSARIVGDVLGRFHPHGDSAVYDTIVRMAQPFSLRYMLVDGQGNFGCFTGDTKIKLVDGTEKSFAELAQLPPDEVFYVYSIDHNGDVVIGDGRYSRITRQNAELIVLELDNGECIRCTPDHRFMLRDGTYKQAQELTTEDSLMPEYTNGMESLTRGSFVRNNHKIVAKRVLKECADVYDITVDKYHNFLLSSGVFVHNSIDSDSPAAMRYTEIRMAKITHEMLADIDKETVDFIPNYDESELEPTVFPTRIPNLLINGSSGIAVGMATNIPPHNLREVINSCVALIDDPSLTVEGLMKHLPAPDFPTAGIINGTTGMLEAYRTGRGRIYMRARTEIEEEEENGKQKIIVTELPYQVNKARLVEKIAELVKNKKIEGISALRDESDKDGIRMVIELRRGEMADVVLNNLFQHTQMQSAFCINMVALVDKQPRLLSLKQLIELFIRHRREVVTRRCVFELRKARERAHILEGLAVALGNIDAMIVLIKAAKNPSEARQSLSAQVWKPGVVIEMLQGENAQASRPDGLSPDFGLTEASYRLSDAQLQAILELRLHRLTGLEQDKILDEFQALLVRINELLEILNNRDRLMQVIRAELLAVRDEYGDERRTQIVSEGISLSIEDLITEEDMVVTLSHEGYVKAQPVSSYSAQKRGGKGKSATQMKVEDFIDKLFVANTHDIILCFTSFGKVYWLKVHQLPQASRISRGKPIVNLLPLEESERINAVLPVREFAKNKFVFMATAKGTVKKTSLFDFSRPRSNGIIAVALDKDDQLIGVDITDGEQDVMLFSRGGKAVRFSEEKVRAIGRTARGVRGIRLAAEDRVISLIITHTGGTVLTATVNGFGKRTPVNDYQRVKSRGGKGVIAIKTTERNGEVVGAVQVKDEDDVMLISSRGRLVRTPVEGVSVVSRNTQGVNLIRLGKGEQLVGLESILDLGAEDDGS